MLKDGLAQVLKVGMMWTMWFSPVQEQLKRKKLLVVTKKAQRRKGAFTKFKIRTQVGWKLVRTKRAGQGRGGGKGKKGKNDNKKKKNTTAKGVKKRSR